MPPHPENSAEFLAGQASQATAALKASLSGIGGDFQKLVLPASWIRQHPIIATATGAGAGLALGLVLTPRRGQSFKQRYTPFVKRMTSRNGRSSEHADASAKPRIVLPLSYREILKVVSALGAKAIAQLVVAMGNSMRGSAFHQVREDE